MRRLDRLATIAAVVAGPLVACGGGAAADAPSPAADVVVHAQDPSTFDKARYTATAGAVRIAYQNDGNLLHTLAIEGHPLKLQLASRGQTKVGDVVLAAGIYTIFCDIAGHRGAGMEATLVVTGP
jgi:plastocyanin